MDGTSRSKPSELGRRTRLIVTKKYSPTCVRYFARVIKWAERLIIKPTIQFVTELPLNRRNVQNQRGPLSLTAQVRRFGDAPRQAKPLALPPARGPAAAAPVALS
jgi:hypothetical protein